MTLDALALAAHIARCAPNVGPKTIAAIVRVESAGDPLAIGDNTAMKSYHPGNRATAEALALRLLGEGHSVDLGITQIDDANLARLGLNVHSVFDACVNIAAGAQILTDDYSTATRYFPGGQVALRHAIGMYNTGRLEGGAAYVRRVLIAAGIRSAGLAPRLRRIVEREATNLAPTQTLTSAAVVVRRAPPRRIAAARAPIIVEKPLPSQVALL